MKEDINLDINVKVANKDVKVANKDVKVANKDVKVANKDVKVANKDHDCVFYTVAGKKYCYVCGKVK